VAAPARDIQKKKAPLPQKKSAAAAVNVGYLEKGLQFLREAKAELKKVTWPSKKQTIGSTVVVIVLVMIISMFLGVVDMALSSLIHIVLQ
jgi:preprotein translocase subunit SecE